VLGESNRVFFNAFWANASYIVFPSLPAMKKSLYLSLLSLLIFGSACGQVLKDLGNEVNLSFDFFEKQFDGEVQEVRLTGGSALLPFLEESFEKIFEKRTKTWNPIEGLKVKADNVDVEALNQLAPQLAVALGLAASI